MRINRSQFFNGYRTQFGKLAQKQVDGLNFLLDKIEADTFTLEQAAYVLATVAHETDRTFQPIKEKRARVGTKVRALQDKYWDSGFYGRGYVQLTWKANYEKYGIADNPDAALQPEKAYEILSNGMRKGTFTGKKLTDYIIAGDVDYIQARRIVNGLDRANDIAEIADKFESILRAASKESSVTESVTEEKIKGSSEEKRLEPPAVPPLPSEQKHEELPEQQPQPPAAPQAPKSPVTPVEAPPTSITTKIAAATSAIAPVLTAAGIKIGGVELSTAGVIALSMVVIVGMVLAAWIYNSSQERRERRQARSMDNLASDVKSNVIAAGSKV